MVTRPLAKRRLTTLLFGLLLAIVALAGRGLADERAGPSFGQMDKIKEGTLEAINPGVLWMKRDKRPILRIFLATLLTGQQKDLVNSGFSTFSQIAIFPDVPEASLKFRRKDAAVLRPLWQLSCSVKYDTWEERYEVVRLEKEVMPEQVKEFDIYAQRCLSLTAEEGEPLRELARVGGRLRAVLVVDQIAADQSAQIKDWLVKQQSGMIQGLFAHMLGDMKLSEKGEFFINIPPAGRNLGQVGALSIGQ